MSGIVFHQLSHHSNLTDTLPRNSAQFSISYSKFHSSTFRFLPYASSSSSASVSSAEQWLDPKTPPQQRKKRIAGIDQDELLDPQHLADPDSCFCEFKGVHLHHKLYSADESQPHTHSTSLKIALPIILLHGFGASVFSWSRVMKRLAEVAASKVLAFDRPAFGLTSRLHSSSATTTLNPYSMAFSVLATLYFIDFLASDKAILIGHSAGSLVAVNSYFEAPERIAALILVAPAIIALSSGRNETGRDTQDKRKGSNSNMFSNQFIKLLEIVSKFTAKVTQAIMQMVKGMTDMLKSLYKKVLSTILCSALGVMLIRMLIDKFGIAAVKIAWYDSNQVTEHVLDGYTKPLRAKGWDKALAEFTAATLASSVSDSKPPLSRRLHEISCPVLIITGDNDRIVPAWNATRLSEAIPGSCLKVIKHCGHLPHEEKVEEFVSAVEKFLQKAFADSKGPSKEPSVPATS
ncbi:2-hydroxy-6-oxononadienedioate/2-hydroxy-6-oxononatrienedioate hydrolase isoform X1 [Ricinus communis]|uniref:2-hydroxy-6-oxononadienedioate/2-hydroxy-6- oxononatrienedioate hydrolase isoform X1 n=1 Tax=Ricinus communis TaxID=3988 RepID=UPI00201AD9F7|nr:2-hydroxy-6-oxononadienedioate/2-hydroxy-6-oxononatrienedioate hydrolase isoform X1 [Ricinus communis]